MLVSGLFFASAYATILTPGPNMMYTANTAAQRGVRIGVLAALAVAIGGVCYTLTTALGISALMAAHPAVFNAIRVVGMLYLIWLGARLLYRAREAGPEPAVPRAGMTAFRGGLVIALTNPQLALFFLAFLPQFVVVDGRSVPLQFLELGLTFNLCAFSTMVGVAIIAGTAGSEKVGGARFRQVMRAVAGVAFLVLATKTAIALLR